MFERMLDREEQGDVDPDRLGSRWMVLNLHAGVAKRRPRWKVGFEVPEAIAHLLDDQDIRAKDRAYAKHQWAAAREWLNA